MITRRSLFAALAIPLPFARSRVEDASAVFICPPPDPLEIAAGALIQAIDSATSMSTMLERMLEDGDDEFTDRMENLCDKELARVDRAEDELLALMRARGKAAVV